MMEKLIIKTSRKSKVTHHTIVIIETKRKKLKKYRRNNFQKINKFWNHYSRLDYALNSKKNKIKNKGKLIMVCSKFIIWKTPKRKDQR